MLNLNFLKTLSDQVSGLKKTIVFALLLVFSLTALRSEGQVSLTFKYGFLGTQGNNSNSTTGNLTFATLGISSVSFGQPYTGQFGANAGTQGNDLAGTVKFYMNSGQVITLTGALNFRNNGNTRDIFGFIFDPGQNASFTYGSGQTFNIVSGTTASTSTSLGLRSYSSTYTIVSTFGGNASTNGLLDALNAELANTPQPSSITLTNNSVTEGQNLVYNVALSSATSAGVPQVYTFSSAGTSSGTVDFNTTYTFSNGVVNNGDGTITVPGGVSTFSIIVSTIDDAVIESSETLILSIGSKSATGNILDNDAIPAITTTGVLKTFTSCSGCIVAPQSFTVSGVYLTNNILVTAPIGVQVSTNANSGFATSINIAPTAGTVTTTTVYAKLTNNATSVSSGVISLTSTGAAAKTISVTTNTDNALSFSGSNKLNIGNPIFTDGQQNFTIELWIKPTDASTTTFRGLIGASGLNNLRSPSLWQYGRKIHFDLVEDNATTNSGLYGGFTVEVLNIGQWNHIAYIKNGTSVSFLVNGNPVAIDGLNSTTKTVPNNFYAIQDYSIGGIDNYFNSAMDDVRFWSTARTADDIRRDMYTELTGNEAGLLSNFQFNQGTIGGTTSGLTITAKGSLSSTISPTASANINIVSGLMPSLSSSSNSFTVPVGSSITLSNGLLGGTWTSGTTGVATVSSTGVVTPIASGTSVITYTICGKEITATVTAVQPTITVSGTLKQFTSCSGCTIPAQSFTISGTNLGASAIITAPTGFEVSNALAGTYSATLSLTPTSGTLATTNVYARLINNAITSANGNFTVTSTGAVSKTVTATVNTDNALNFDGVNDIVVLDNTGAVGNLAFTGTASFTLEAWVKREGNAGLQMVISKYKGGLGGNYYLALNNGKPLFNRESYPYSVISDNVLPINEWHHIAGVYDGSNMKMYVDGILVKTEVGHTGSIGSVSSIPVAIGGGLVNGGTVSYMYKGAADEVRIWNTARTSDQIRLNYLNELAGNETGLVAYYNFNQGIVNTSNSSIATLTDRTSNATNGAITNMPLSGSTSNFVIGFIPEISGASIVNKGLTTSYTDGLTGGVWSSAATNIATVDPTTGVVTGVNPGTSTITYTICEKTVSKLVTVVVPTITKTGSLTAFNTCLGTASAAQTFTVSAQYLSTNLVVTAPTGYELSTDGSTYSSTLSIVPSSGTVSARLIYVRLSNASVNGQSGNVSITSTGVLTQNVVTGTASVTRTVAASVTISSNATSNSICTSTNVVFTASPTNGGTTPTYQWKLNGNNITGANSATYSTTTLANNDVITVLMGSSLTSCVTGTPATSNSITTTVTSIPATPGVISGLTTICLNSNQVYSVAAVTGATSYTWIVTGNISASISSTTNIVNITAANNQGIGTIEVFASNACGTSIGSASLSITVNNTPAPTAGFTVSPNAGVVCLTSPTVTFTNTSSPNAGSTLSAYNWDFGDGSSQVTTQNASRTYTASGIYDVVMNVTSSNNCTSSFSSRITVDPISVAGTSAAAASTICEGSNTILTLTGNTGLIQWQSSTDGINFNNITGATTASLNTGNLTATTYYQAVVTSGSCSAATSGVVTVTVSPKPLVTLSPVANVNATTTSFDLIYNNTVGSPDEYSISSVAPNSLPNFNTITNFGLIGSPITVAIPASSAGVYNFNLTIANGALGCISGSIPFTLTVVPAPPAGLSYTTPNVYTKGTTITALNPTSTGGPITQYTIGPSLPAGLTIDPITGIISGTPTATSAQTTYTVTGTNASGTITATVVITVVVAAPAGLSYTTPNVYTKGTTITALNPTSTGGPITQYTIGPSLPAGLTIDPTTGIISGTPTATSAQTTYTVTGTNASGTITATVVITVNDIVPSGPATPAGLSYTTPNVYTTGTAITALNPTSTGGPITQYTIGPSLPAGLTIDPTTGIISGTPTATSTQTTYTVTGTNASGTITATVVITVNSGVVPPTQPQGSLGAIDYGLLAADTVKLKLTTSNGTAPFTLILSNSINTLKDTITNLTPINNVIEFSQKRLDTTKVFSMYKLIDANNNTRTTGFTKDTTIVRVLKPQILLTLKADPAVKQEDNSFKTRLLLKIKNAGQLNLRNVQVNANLSTVFPSGITYILDSVRVLTGGLVLNPNYSGAGSAISASSSEWLFNASSNGTTKSFAVLDGNYLFNNGVNLNQSEEGEVAYYVSIGATTQNVTLKLQFETAGDGVLVKNDGSASAQETKSISDDGTNITQHPDLTNDGVPLPTYVPLFPNEKIGASLNVGSATPVTGGYQFHFTAKVKNYGNVNLDSLRIQYNFNKIFPTPDVANIVGVPTVTRGNMVYNLNNFDGYSNVNMFDYGGDLQVGDSATYEYDLKVTTTRTDYTWQNYFVAYGRSLNSGIFISDTSMAGIDPDPNNDNDPIEHFFTGVTINYNKPAPPIVENKMYTYGEPKPINIRGLVKSTPTGTVPVWCDTKTAACSVNPPSTPTEIGKYIYALRSYDTTTLLYSDVLVYDTVIIRPPLPIVVNKKYIIGASTNPNNVSGQVTGMTGSTLKYFKSAGLLNTIPTLGVVPGVTRYTTSQTVNNIESDTAGFTVTMLDPKTMLHLQKIAEEPKLQSNSTFNITYTFLVNNRTDEPMSNVLVVDNLQNTFPQPTVFTKVSMSSTGGLVTNNGFNGMADINLLSGTSTLAAFAIDTIRLTINLQPKGYTGTVNNVAVITATTPYGVINMNSSSQSFANETSKTPTPSVIPDLTIDIPEAFSPNRDGVNDRFVVLKPFGTTLDLEVYNRWGNVVYANGNYNNEWDGRGTNNFIGQDLMDGGYYYTLKAKSVNGNIQIFKGFVLIQR